MCGRMVAGSLSNLQTVVAIFVHMALVVELRCRHCLYFILLCIETLAIPTLGYRFSEKKTKKKNYDLKKFFHF